MGVPAPHTPPGGSPAPTPQRPAPSLRPVPTPDPNPPDPGPPALVDRLSGLAGRLSGLRPPDVWNTPAPTLREEVARVMEGSHLPDQAWLRRAETARAVVSAGISAVLLLLVHINRSAARQGVALLVLAVLVAVAAIWTR